MTHIKKINEFFDKKDEFQTRLAKIINTIEKEKNNPMLKTLSDENLDAPEWYIKIAERYDDVCDNAFWVVMNYAFGNNKSDDIYWTIEDMAEKNELENGTEKEYVLDFIEYILRKCRISVY